MSGNSHHEHDNYFLIGDIGGTNLRVELKDRHNVSVKKLVVKTSDFKNFSEFIRHFFKDEKIQPPQVYGAICIASKILNNKAVTNANYNWELADGDAVKQEFGFKQMILLNDFEACGYAVPKLNTAELVLLKGDHHVNFNADYKVMLVGPGTGLGVCLVTHK